jgi:uncharacterized membrane protein
MMYGLLAAIFIAIRDIFSKDLINRYHYIDYIILANIIVFISTVIYLMVNKRTVKIKNNNDFIIILLRL